MDVDSTWERAAEPLPKAVGNLTPGTYTVMIGALAEQTGIEPMAMGEELQLLLDDGYLRGPRSQSS